MSVKGDKVECSINGTVVGTYDKAAVVGAGKLKSTDGVYGIRFAHNTEGHGEQPPRLHIRARRCSHCAAGRSTKVIVSSGRCVHSTSADVPALAAWRRTCLPSGAPQIAKRPVSSDRVSRSG